MPHNHIGGDSRDKFPELEPIFAAVEGAMGYLPNAYLGMAKRPELLKAFSGLVATIFASEGIDQVEKSIVAYGSVQMGLLELPSAYFSWSRKGRCKRRKNF